MKYYVLSLLSLVVALAWVPSAKAQEEHGEVGVFADYFRLNQGHTGFAGLGGRAQFKANRFFGIEAEMNYDFSRTFVETFSNPSGGAITVARSNMRILHGLFGPVVSTGFGPVRVYATVKPGFIDFRFDPRPATFATFGSTVQDLRNANVKFALYPGAGIEAQKGIIGLRLEVGDEMYWSGGAHHSLRLTGGPIIRF
jgi:hypothetical protein